MINRSLLRYSNTILLVKIQEPRFRELRIKLFIKRFICAISKIDKLSTAPGNLKPRTMVRSGSFGANLRIDPKTNKYSVEHGALVHPLEQMLEGHMTSCGTAVALNFITGIPNTETACRAGFWKGEEDERFSSPGMDELYNISKFILNKTQNLSFRYRLSPELTSLVEQELNKQRSTTHAKA